MREILFRGKRLDNGEWLEGFYYNMAETTYCFEEDYKKFPVSIHHYIMVERMTDWGLPNRMCQAEVNTETVCQYTGLNDKNGRKIFDGDIVKDVDEELYIIEWDKDIARYVFVHDEIAVADFGDTWAIDIEVIGNVFDNPELMEVQDETD